MSRRIGMPVRVETDAAGLPCAFTWRGATYRVQVIHTWRLRDRWWGTVSDTQIGYTSAC